MLCGLLLFSNLIALFEGQGEEEEGGVLMMDEEDSDDVEPLLKGSEETDFFIFLFSTLFDLVGEDLEFQDNADDPYIDQNYQSESSDEGLLLMLLLLFFVEVLRLFVVLLCNVVCFCLDVAVKSGDQLILAAHSEDEQASLSVYLYNDELEQL